MREEVSEGEREEVRERGKVIKGKREGGMGEGGRRSE